MVGFVSLLAASSVAAQTWVTPETGTGTISGRVVAADSGEPISRAEVHLTGRVTKVLSADGLGRYAFTELPAGRYTLTAGRNGHLTMGYGQHRPHDGVRYFELADGQSRDRIDFALPDGGVIEILVTDEAGEPVEGVFVEAQQFRHSGGARRLLALPSTALRQRNFETDDRGRVRLYDLPPGVYYLRALFRRPKSPPTEPGTSAHKKLVYLPTFYPGKTAVTEAVPVTLALGQEMSLHLPLMPSQVEVTSTDAAPNATPAMPTATLRATVVPDDVTVSVWTPGEFLLYLAMTEYSHVQIGIERDGTFTATGLTGTALGWTGEGQGWFLQAVMRGDRDVTDSPLSFSSGMEVDDIRVVITRQFTTVSGEARDEHGERVSAFVALVFAEDPARWTPASRFIVRAQSEADGRFSIIGLPAGRYRAAALDALDYGDERDPELLSRLKSKAAPIAIRDGESVTLTLPLVTF